MRPRREVVGMTTFHVRPYGRDVRWGPLGPSEPPIEVPTHGEARRLADALTAEHGKQWCVDRTRGRLSRVEYVAEASA